MTNYGIILKALFKNKLRFNDAGNKKKIVAFALLIAFAYLIVMAVLISMIVSLKTVLMHSTVISFLLYFFILMTAAVVVLFFGIVHLISVLYLSKDTDFYSALPVKPVTVFAAKLSYVYIFETAVVVAIALPLLIAFGIVAQMWVWFYVISILTLFITPALPLVVSAIVAVPVMLLASKLKNRNLISLIFYLLLFGGCFSVYIYFIYMLSSGSISPEAIVAILEGIETVLNVFYPYKTLSASACGVRLYGLSMGASTVVGLAIFLGISAVLLAIIMLLAKFMYVQAVKANNQTDSSKAKKGDFKTSTGMRALIKREYISSLRTTQIAFQCYAVMLLPIIMSVIFGIMANGVLGAGEAGNIPNIIPDYFGRYLMLISFCTLCAMFATLGNASSTTFSREGSAMSSLKILPVKPKTVLISKVAAWLIIAVPAAVVAVVVLNAMNFVWQDFLLSLFALVPIAALFVIFGALWDLSAPKLNWTDPIQAVKHNMHVFGGQMIMLGCGFVVMIVMFVLNGASVDYNIMRAVCWALLYTVLGIFTVVDILMYRKIDLYYDRIEI